MKGKDITITGGNVETVSLNLGPSFTHFEISNETGAKLYCTVNGGVPSSTNAHFVVQNESHRAFSLDNMYQTPPSLRVVSSGSGHIHIVGW